MEEIVTVVYETDKFHSLQSRVVIGVFDNENLFKKFIKEQVEQEIEENFDSVSHDFHQGYSKEDYIKMTLDFFDSNMQTQHLFDWELEAHKMILNKGIDE